MNIIRFINKPYPFNADLKNKIILVGLLSPLIITIFQPFGLNNFQSNYKYLIFMGYGVVSVLMELFNFFILPKLFPKILNEDDWKIFKQGIWQTWILISKGPPIYYYSILFTDFGDRFSGISSFFILLGILFALAMVHVPISVLITYNKFLRENLHHALSMNTKINNTAPIENKLELITLFADNNKKLQIQADHLFYITSEGNYIRVFYYDDDAIKNELLRNTLKNCELQIQQTPYLFKCHRAYIVNLMRVKSVEGNAKGYRLTFPNSNVQIPVSRNLNTVFQKKMEAI